MSDVPAAAVVAMVAADVRREQPLHPMAEIAVAVRPQHQVKVIGHQAPRQNPHRQTLASGLEEPDEGRVIVLPVKHLAPAVPPIENVVAPIAELEPEALLLLGRRFNANLDSPIMPFR